MLHNRRQDHHYPRDAQRKSLARRAAALASEMLGVPSPAPERSERGKRSSYRFDVPAYTSVRGPVDYITVEVNRCGLSFHSRVDNDHPSAELPLVYPGHFPTQKWNHYIYDPDPEAVLRDLRSLFATLEPTNA